MLKNYTSTVSASRSVQRIENKLVACGARKILKLYENNKLSGIAFIMDINGQQMPFRMPARVGRVEEQLKAKIRRPRSDTYKNIAAQAERTAWKLLSDWIEVQVSLIELQQVKFLEIFLPYVYNAEKDQTYFEELESNGFKQLTFKAGNN